MWTMELGLYSNTYFDFFEEWTLFTCVVVLTWLPDLYNFAGGDMKNTLISRILVLVAAVFVLASQVFAGDMRLYDYSLNKKPDTLDNISFIEATQPTKPDYSLVSIRFTPNPNISFDGKPPRNELWPKLTTSADFMGISQNEIPVNYSLSDADNRRKLIEKFPFLPYFHFESGNANENTSAGILFWGDSVKTFWSRNKNFF